MIMPVSLIVLLRGLIHYFSHGASHPYIPILIDFCTCSTYVYNFA